MADNNNLFKERAQIVANLKKMQEEIGKNEARQTEEYITQQKRLKEILSELKRIKSETDSALGVSESFSSSLGGIYRNLDSSLKSQKSLIDGLSSKMVDMEISAGGFNDANQQARGQVGNILAGYSLLAELQDQISQLSYEDVEQRQVLNQQISDAQSLIAEEVASLDKRTKIGKEFMSIQGQLNSQAEQRTNEAKKLGALTEDEKRVLESQLKVFDQIKSKVNAIEETLVTFVKRPQAAIGALVAGFGTVINKIGDVNRELGTTLFQADGVGRKAGVLSFIFEDAAGTAKNLSSELGSTDRATFGLQTNVGLMAMNMGISNSEASTLVGSFTRLNGNSTDVASDMVATSREFAKQNGIIPSQLMGDLAASAEEFALFGKQGGNNILEAAGYAAKLGVNMKTISGVADNLLDFESSITKELELGAMLGRNINLNKARELAFAGKIDEAAKETLKVIGGQAAFEKMNYYQKKQTADLLGVSVAELQKMVSNEQQAASLGGVLNEEFSKFGEFINGGLNKYLGTSLQGLGGMIASTGQLGLGFNALGTSLGGVVRGTAQILKNLLGMVAGPVLKGLKGVGSALANSGVGKRVGSFKDKLLSGVGDKFKKPNVPDTKSGGNGISSITDSISKIKPSQILAGAAALVIVAGAVFVFGKAAQEFMKVSWGAVGKAVVSMLALVGSVALLGAIMSSGFGAVAILAGAAAMLVVAGAVFVLGKAIQEIGKGFEIIGSVGSKIAEVSSYAGQIGLLALSLGGLALAVGALGIASLVALPGIASLGLLSLAITPLATAFSNMTPALQAFGNVLNTTFSGISSVIESISSGIVSMLGAITLESAAAVTTLGLALPVLAVGLGALSVAALLGGNKVASFFQTIGESATLLGGGAAQGLQTTAQALMSMGSGLAVINEQLDRLNPEKLEALSNFSMSLSIGGAVNAIGESIGGLVDSVSAVIGGGEGEEGSLSQYETDALRYLERIALATEKGATIKGRDRSAFNPMGINNN